MTATNAYAVDGKCHNAEPGTFGHECGKPAVWLGTKMVRPRPWSTETPGEPEPFTSGYCDDCKQHGFEAKGCTFVRIG